MVRGAHHTYSLQSHIRSHRSGALKYVCPFWCTLLLSEFRLGPMLDRFGGKLSNRVLDLHIGRTLAPLVSRCRSPSSMCLTLLWAIAAPRLSRPFAAIVFSQTPHDFVRIVLFGRGSIFGEEIYTIQRNRMKLHHPK